MFLCAEGMLPGASSKSTDNTSATTTSSCQDVDEYTHKLPKLHEEQHNKWHDLLQHQRKQQQQSLHQTLSARLHPLSSSSMNSSSPNSPSSPLLKMYERSLQGELGASNDER